MIPLLGNVVENKKFRPTNQEPKIIQEDCIQGFTSWLTNRCSGSRVGEDRRCRSPQLGISMTSQPRGYLSRALFHDPLRDLSREPSRDPSRSSPTNKSLEHDLRGRRRTSKKDQRYDPSTGIHTSRCSNPAALRRPERNATERN